MISIIIAALLFIFFLTATLLKSMKQILITGSAESLKEQLEKKLSNLTS